MTDMTFIQKIGATLLALAVVGAIPTIIILAGYFFANDARSSFDEPSPRELKWRSWGRTAVMIDGSIWAAWILIVLIDFLKGVWR